MCKIKLIANLFAVILGLVCLFPSQLNAADVASESGEESLLSDTQLESRVNNMTSMIDLRYNRKIGNYIRTYINNRGKSTDKLLGRVTNYFPIFEAELRKRDLPQELKILAVIESSLRPTVRSRVGAVGLWQFMHGTAKQYGLTISTAVDERRDPFRSTEAAAEFLKDLHERFDDWTLAIAAYNCGPGRISKAIRQSGSRNYWELLRYLPKETQNYVPKFIAAFYLMNYYYLHDIYPSKPSIDLQSTSLTKIYEGISFNDIINMTGISLKSLKKMNPAYIGYYIPDNNKGFNLLLPENSMLLFLEGAGRNKSPSGDKDVFSTSEVRPSFVSFSEIVESTRWVIRIKMEEVPQLDKFEIPEEYFEIRSATKSINDPSGSAYRDEKGKYELYRLGKGESIMDIVCRRNDLKLKDVLILNDISLARPPLPGAILKLKKI